MLKKLNGVIYAYIAIIIFVLAIFYQTLHLYYFTSKIIPFILCLGVFVLTIVGIINELQKIRTTDTDKKSVEKKQPKDKSQKSMLECALYVFILAFLIYALGFLVAMPVFMLVYIKYNGGGWVESVVTAVVVSGVVYVVFDLILQTNLYQGKLFILLG